MRDDSSSWDHEKGVGKQIFLVTGCSTFQPSPMVVSGEGCVHPSSQGEELGDLGQDASWEPPFGGFFPSVSNQEKTQNSLWGLHISSGQGMPRDSLGRAGEYCWGDGRLEHPVQSADPNPVKWMKEDE